MDRARACGLDLLRKVVDQHTLDQALSETDTINADIRKILDIATHEWGVEATLVELKDTQLPDSEARDGSPSRGRAREASQNYCGRADSREGRWNPTAKSRKKLRRDVPLNVASGKTTRSCLPLSRVRSVASPNVHGP